MMVLSFVLPSISGPGQLDFREHGADHGVDPLRPPRPGISNRLTCSVRSCFAISLQFSQSIVHNFFSGDVKFKNLFIMMGDTAPCTDDAALSILDLSLWPVLGLSTDIAIASNLPLSGVIKQL